MSSKPVKSVACLTSDVVSTISRGCPECSDPLTKIAHQLKEGPLWGVTFACEKGHTFEIVYDPLFLRE